MNSVERYYNRKRRRKRKAKVVFFTLLFIMMIITLAVLSMTVFFNAETITVEGNTRYTAAQLLEQGGLTVGQNLFRLDKFEVMDKMEQLPYVKQVEIDRKLPNGLKITVVENQPVVWVPTNDGAALLNEEYRVLEFITLPGAQDAASEDEGEKTTEESTPAPSPLDGVPQLTQAVATHLVVGEAAQFGEVDYEGFLKRLYDGFCAQSDLSWQRVNEVQFFARYDIKVLYAQHVTIDFGTLDRVDVKLQLAHHLIKSNGTGQTATVDVSDTERVYYRPKRQTVELDAKEEPDEKE